MQRLVLLCALLSAQTFRSGFARRVMVAGSISSHTEVDETPLNQFIAETALDCSGCGEVNGLLIGNLVQGLVRADKVKEITYEGSVLKVKLENMVYGQVATRSSVPVMWVVDNELTARVSDVQGGKHLSLTGLHTDVPAQAYGIYEQMMGGAGVAITDDLSMGNLKKEHKAATSFMKTHYKKGFKNIGTSQKVGKVLRSTYSHLSGAIKPFIAWDNWGSIGYSMVTATPKTITDMTVAGDTVVAMTVPWTESPNHAKAAAYHLLEKAQILGADAMTNCPSMLAGAVAKASKSGWGFGMMFGHGDPVVADQIKSYPKSNPKFLVNLFSLCEKGSAEEDPECSGSDVGRLHWTDTVPAEYQ